MCVCVYGKVPFFHMEYIVIYIIILIKAFLCLIKHHDIERGDGGGIVQAFLTFVRAWGESLASSHSQFFLCENNLNCPGYEVGWTKQLVWTSQRREKYLLLFGIGPHFQVV